LTTRSRRAVGLIKLAPGVEKPLSHQLADTLRRLIVDGIWIKDDRLPGSRTIADDARVSRNTVNAALEILINEGMLEARGRSGLYVTWKHAGRGQRVETAAKEDEPARRRPFSIEALPLDVFPLDAWKRLQARYWSKASVSVLETVAPAGALPLRAAIATLVNVSAGISCQPEQVFVVTGLPDALMLLKSLQPDNAAAWLEDPTHEQVRLAVRLSGMRGLPIPVDSQGMIVDMAMHIDGDARFALVRPAFQYPTGAMLSPARARELIDWAKKHGALILEDATESEFSLSKRTFRSLAALDLSAVVHFNSFNRTLFPALGISFMIVPEHLVEECTRIRRQTGVQIPLAPQMVLAEFINSGQFAKHVRAFIDLAVERQTILLENLATLGNLLVADRQFGGLHVCARLTGREDDTAIVERAVAAGLDVEALSTTFVKRPGAQGLLLGFAAFDRPAIEDAVRSLRSVLTAQR